MPKIILPLFISLVTAQSLDLPKTIDVLNRKVKDMKGPEHCATCDYTLGQDAPPQAWKSCLKEICGEQLSADLKKTERILATPYIESPEFGALAPLIKGAFRQSIELKGSLLRKTLDWLKRAKPLNDSHAQRIAFYGRSQRSARHLQYNGRGELDSSRSYDSLLSSGLSSEEAKLVLEIAKTPQESEKSVQSTLAQIELIAKKSSLSTGLPPEVLIPSVVKLRAWDLKLGEERLTKGEAVEASQTLASLKRFQFFLDDEKIGRFAARHAAEWTTEMSTERLSAELKELENYLSGKPAPAIPRLQLAQQLERHVFQCYAHFALRSSELPLNTDLKRFLKNEEPTLRKKFIKKLRGFLSSASAQWLESELQSATVLAPESREAFLRRAHSDLKRLTEINSKSLAELAKPPLPESQERAAAFVLAPDLLAIGSALSDLCSEEASDSFDTRRLVTSKNRLTFPAAAITAGLETDFVIYHVYSHYAARFLQTDARVSPSSQDWMQSLKNCLSQGHGDQSEPRGLEDFADLLAMSFSGAGGTYFCAHPPEDESSITVRDWHPEDSSQSGLFYRILHHRILTGAGVPETCRLSLAEKSEAPFERNCLKETPEAAHR